MDPWGGLPFLPERQDKIMPVLKTKKDLDSLVKIKVLGLLKIMKPLDLVNILMKKMDLRPKEASRIVVNLLKKVHTKESLQELDFVSFIPKPIDKGRGFPPPPIKRPTEWPYDNMTVAIMDPHSKGKKKGLTTSFDPADGAPGLEDPNIIIADPSKVRRDGPGHGAPGLQQKNSPHSIDGDQSSSSSSWSKTGPKGWARSMKSFDMPDNSSSQQADPVAGPPPLVQTPPQAVVNTKQPRMGFRRK